MTTMSAELNGMDLRRELDAAEEQIRNHPGQIEHAEVLALHRSLTDVFIPNWGELRQLLEQASTSVGLAFELIQNVHRPDVRERFQSLTTQRLHNYGAATMTLVDHARRLMRGRTGPVAEEYERRKADLLQHPEVPFIQDLRNYMLHRRLPNLLHQLSVTGVNTDHQRMESEVQLSTTQLLTWDDWKTPSRGFLEAHGSEIALRPVIASHGQVVATFNRWLVATLATANAPALEEANEPVVARNAILTGSDIGTAREFTTRWTQMRNAPGPHTTADFTVPDLSTGVHSTGVHRRPSGAPR